MIKFGVNMGSSQLCTVCSLVGIYACDSKCDMMILDYYATT